MRRTVGCIVFAPFVCLFFGMMLFKSLELFHFFSYEDKQADTGISVMVVDQDNKRLVDRLVIGFIDGKEVARTTEEKLYSSQPDKFSNFPKAITMRENDFVQPIPGGPIILHAFPQPLNQLDPILKTHQVVMLQIGNTLGFGCGNCPREPLPIYFLFIADAFFFSVLYSTSTVYITTPLNVWPNYVPTFVKHINAWIGSALLVVLLIGVAHVNGTMELLILTIFDHVRIVFWAIAGWIGAVSIWIAIRHTVGPLASPFRR